MNRTRASALVPASVALVIAGCATVPRVAHVGPLRPAAVPPLDDALPLEPLLAAIDEEVRFLGSSSGAPATFQFGARTIPRAEYLAALQHFASIARAAASREALF